MPDYILEPLDTDPDSILQDAVDYVRVFYPNWNPLDDQLDWLLLRFASFKMAIIADMASRVERAIYMYFGASILNIPPLPEEFATVAFTITAIDTLGHTLDAGALVAVADSNGDLHMFSTISDIVIDVDNDTATGSAEAVDSGISSNNLTGQGIPNEEVDWITSIVVAAPSSGGADAESTQDYLTRLTNNLSLMAPRPILAQDFALILRNIVGIQRAAALDNFLPGTNEQQTISHDYTGNGATGGTLTWGGHTTGPLAYNSTAAQVKAGFEGLINVEVGDVKCSGGPWPAIITIEFTGRYAYTDVPAIIASSGTWTGGTAVSITTTVPGVVADFAAENAVAVSGIDENGVGVSDDIKVQAQTYLEGMRQENFVISVLDPAYSVIDVTWTANKQPQADSADVETRGNSAINSYFSPTNWGSPQWPIDVRSWNNKSDIRIQELYTVLNNIDGIDYVTSLVFSVGSGDPQDALDKTLSGIFPLPVSGNIVGTVT